MFKDRKEVNRVILFCRKQAVIGAKLAEQVERINTDHIQMEHKVGYGGESTQCS